MRKQIKRRDIPADFRPPLGATFFRRWLKINLAFWYRVFYFSSFVKNKEYKAIKQYRGRPVIFACNHRSNSDVATFFLMLSKFKLHFIGKESLFKHKSMNWFLRALNGFPIRYGKNDLAVIRHCVEVLRWGEALAIFPEGRRNFDTESALEIQPGTAVIAMKSGAPVIPIVTNRAARPFRRNLLKVGKVINPTDFSSRDDFSNKLRDEMSRLLDGFEVAPKKKKWDRIAVFNSRAITFIDGKLLVIKRVKQGQTYYVTPGGHMDGDETAREAVVREVMEETNTTVAAVRPLYKRMYKTTRGEGMQVFYLCNYKMGTPAKTNAEEYTMTPEESVVRGTFEPVLIDVETLADTDLRPHEVRDRLVKDIKKYGIHLTRPTIYLK